MQSNFLLLLVHRPRAASLSRRRMTSRVVHPIAHAFSISGANGIYNSARPSYPLSAISHLFSSFPESSDGLSIAELGAGTGIFTRLLLSHGNGRIRDLLVVEPSAGMREGFAKAVEVPRDVNMRVVDGTFDSIDSGVATLDAVVIAQAFHWIGQGATAGESAIKGVRQSPVRCEERSRLNVDRRK